MRLDRAALGRAFDEAEFGPARTLNLRSSLPTASEAAERAEQWLRQQQVMKAGQVLVITGRGKNSPGGVSPVRESTVKRLHSLRRRGVVADWREHTAGSFVVILAPVTALFETMPRRRERGDLPSRPGPAVLEALAPATKRALRMLATRSLETLGVSDPEPFVSEEMVKQFAALAVSIPPAADRESALRAAIRAALEELDS